MHLTMILWVAQFSTSAVTLMPADYLLPPPPLLPPPARPIPLPTAVRFPNSPNSKTLLAPKYNEPPPGIINRVARWFGYANNGQNKWPDVISSADNSKQSAIYYDKKQHGNQQTIDAIKNKNCNICNKYPWMPIFHNSNQWTPQTHTSSLPLNVEKAHDIVEPHHGTSKIKQRAVQYHAPQMNLLNAAPSVYKHTPLSQYNYESIQATATTESGSISVQPQTQSASLLYETHSPSNEHPLKSPSDDDGVEIIKSKEIAEYLSSVEHPVTVIQSQAIDVNVSAHITLPSNHKILPNNNGDFYNNYYQQEIFEANSNRPITPADIISEAGNYLSDRDIPDGIQDGYHSPSMASIYENLTPSYKYLPQYTFDSDNLLAASSQNDSTVEHTSIPTTTTTTKSSTTTERVWITKSNDYHYTTIVSKKNSAEDLKTKWLIGSLHDYGSREYRKNPLQNFLTNIQIPGPQLLQLHQPQHQGLRPRETPKNLLSAPIQHISKGLMDIPRPFTKDPAKLGFHNKIKNRFIASTTIKPNFPMNVNGGNGNNMPQGYLTQTLATPTSTYGGIDASGYYADISASPLPRPTRQPVLSQSTPHVLLSIPTTNGGTNLSSPTKKYVLPFEVKTQPRPFESLKENTSYNVELLPEESMLFDVKSQKISTLHDNSNRNKSKTHAKYLTKILANNLRELLKREHEQPSGSQTNAISFDLIKLQNNIDEWIEQEYNSPSHRASTPTIRGRSKHIPIEYVEMLAATTMKTLKRHGKTFKNYNDNVNQGHTLSISVNSLEPIYSTVTTATTILDEWDEKYKQHAVTENKAADIENSETERSTTNNINDTIYTYVTVSETHNELWRKAAVTVLPETQEKLYVVTPQPKLFMKNSESSLKMLNDMFITPRFSIRPTIQLEVRTESPQTHHTTNLFGLKGLTTYVPNRPVDIIDGNSKVVMVVTPSVYDETSTITPTFASGVMDLTKMKHTTIKPTLSPTPR